MRLGRIHNPITPVNDVITPPRSRKEQQNRRKKIASTGPVCRQTGSASERQSDGTPLGDLGLSNASSSHATTGIASGRSGSSAKRGSGWSGAEGKKGSAGGAEALGGEAEAPCDATAVPSASEGRRNPSVRGKWNGNREAVSRLHCARWVPRSGSLKTHRHH